MRSGRENVYIRQTTTRGPRKIALPAASEFHHRCWRWCQASVFQWGTLSSMSTAPDMDDSAFRTTSEIRNSSDLRCTWDRRTWSPFTRPRAPQEQQQKRRQEGLHSYMEGFTVHMSSSQGLNRNSHANPRPLRTACFESDGNTHCLQYVPGSLHKRDGVTRFRGFVMVLLAVRAACQIATSVCKAVRTPLAPRQRPWARFTDHEPRPEAPSTTSTHGHFALGPD